MSKMDFELTSKVIPSLLNNIIYSNEIDLKVSEIEGDAVLFYRTGGLPSFRALVEQCRYFYTEFYLRLEELRIKHSDLDGASKIPEILGLKIVLHFGSAVALLPIGKRIKLMGEDVISAHRLLKNDIPLEEYIIFSEELISQYEHTVTDGDFDWETLKQGSIKVDHIGTIKFKYVNLTPLVD
jgi:hypothetical protein